MVPVGTRDRHASPWRATAAAAPAPAHAAGARAPRRRRDRRCAPRRPAAAAAPARGRRRRPRCAQLAKQLGVALEARRAAPGPAARITADDVRAPRAARPGRAAPARRRRRLRAPRTPGETRVAAARPAPPDRRAHAALALDRGAVHVRRRVRHDRGGRAPRAHQARAREAAGVQLTYLAYVLQGAGRAAAPVPAAQRERSTTRRTRSCSSATPPRASPPRPADGLTVPVVHDADRLTLFAHRARDRAARDRGARRTSSSSRSCRAARSR